MIFRKHIPRQSSDDWSDEALEEQLYDDIACIVIALTCVCVVIAAFIAFVE